jgi:hypothetical protein
MNCCHGPSLSAAVAHDVGVSDLIDSFFLKNYFKSNFKSKVKEYILNNREIGN